MEHRNTLMLELSKLMITLSTGAIGFLLTTASTLFVNSHQASSFYLPIGGFLCAILFSMLSVMGLIDIAENKKPKFKIITDKNVFMIAWAAFLVGLGATVFELI
ncbi:hypothetical protein RJD38_18935 [Vibrio scophthalmi]|uniref:Uncharacterized protein n=1 Tax=Vibrio scophthalmi TaxID=45658 RepID=A0A1C7FG22_9VIBR|nr:hypothetical protein [Vibrio scophthalmi]ANU38284.1 hypothetical protein VSVS05_03246 [Vibrio scophthalmi]